MDRAGILEAIGLPCRFAEYESLRNGVWCTVTEGSPARKSSSGTAREMRLGGRGRQRKAVAKRMPVSKTIGTALQVRRAIRIENGAARSTEPAPSMSGSTT